jgi:hypothetical protein
MQQITIRGIDPEVEKEIRKIARYSRKSINHPNVIESAIRRHMLLPARLPCRQPCDR